MIDAIVSGRLHGTAVARMSKTGSPFATAKVRASSRDGEVIFVNVIAFAPHVVDALLALGDGDSIALAGELTPGVWRDKNGEPQPVLGLLAHAELSVYHIQRRRRASSSSTRAAATTDGTSFDDELPQ